MYGWEDDIEHDVEHDIDIDLLIDPDDECDVSSQQPPWLWDAPEPEDEDRPDAYATFDQMAENAA